MKVVMYLMSGHYHATRHAPGCGILRRAEQAAAGEVTPGRGDRPTVFDADRFPYADLEPKDHACVAKAGVL